MTDDIIFTPYENTITISGPRWIKVEDQKPPIGKPVLLNQTYPATTCFTLMRYPLERSFIRWGGYADGNIFVSYEDQESKEGLKYVTHWMEIEPPKDD